ncbi:MAG: transcription elongation factor GreA [Spirochaetaceae bacterium]|nr:transcription elongation factor GreA [Spirochaetaceae bacterium]
MSDDLIKNVQNILTEEKFTRAALSNYSITQFKDLDAVLKEAEDAHALDEVRAECDEYLTHSKNSIKALYLSGMIAISRQIIDDAVLVNLVSLFADNHKWNIVKYLCERILEKGESKFALRTLAECYRNEGNEEAVFETWQRLVKIDFDEADITKTLAEHFENEGDEETAVDYYKKALGRYINKGQFAPVREIWQKLIDYRSLEIDFFLSMQGKVAKSISPEKAAALLQDVYLSCKKRDDIDTAIDVLKLIFTYDERDAEARKEIAECYRVKYANHSHLEEYIKLSNLTASYRNVQEAIQDFEKHIAFDKGNFVFHRSWGVGRIAKVETDDVTIDFAKKRGHTMALKMAIDALTTLSKDHIWVLKATQKKEKLYEQVKTDPIWTLKTIIKSFNNFYDIRKLKSELVPSVLSENEWTTWNTKVRKILKTDPSFGVSPDNVDVFSVRDRQNSLAEKLYNEFKAEKKFLNRVDIIRKFENAYDPQIDAEYFADMFSYFTGFLKSYNHNQVNEQVLGSYLLIKEIASRVPALAENLHVNFVTLFEEIDDITAVYAALKDKKLQAALLKEIKLFVATWFDVYVKLFPLALRQEILDELLDEGHKNSVASLVRNCFNNYRDNRNAVIWFYKTNKEAAPEWYAEAAITQEKEVVTLIHILDTSFHEIENHINTLDNKKIIKQVIGILFESGLIYDYIDAAGVEAIDSVYTPLQNVKDLDPALKDRFRKNIMKKYPDFKFSGIAEKDTAIKGLLVTMAAFDEKQKQLAKIMEEDIPANAKEIAFALSLGDLRENAEFKAAKEKQTILNSTVAKLKDDIERAQLFDPSTVTTNRVSFGTKVLVRNETKNADEEYTILGPWESNPDKKIISYLSPFGNAILNRKAGDKFEFKIADSQMSYEIKEITGARI